MWVFSRKAGETIHIGDEMKVTVRRVVGNRVTLIIEVPAGSRILRGECQAVEDVERIIAEKQAKDF